jgi:hypothetical protein
MRSNPQGGGGPTLGTNGGRREAAMAQAAAGRFGHEREERGEKERERRKKGLRRFKFPTSHTSRSDVTESCRLLYRDW